MKNIYSILSLVFLLISVSVVGQTKIYAPNLRAPENLEIKQMPDVILDWDAVTGTGLDIEYEAQLASNSEFTDAVTFPLTDVTAQTMSDLIFGAKYYWHVRAYDGDDVSGWSETWSFSVVWTVSMLKPNDDDDGIFSNPEITWNLLDGVDGYTLQVDTSYAWNDVESGVTANINATSIISADDMWAVGASGLVLHNDGTGWTNVDAGTSDNLNGVFFIDATNGYVIGDGGTVLYYDGATWTSVDVGITDNLLGISFIDNDNGVVVGDGGTVVIYNGGTWEIATTGDNNDLFDVSMINPSNIWVCGKGKIVVNYDGTDWFANVVGTKDHYGIAMIDENNGWTVGKGGKIYGWDGNEWFAFTSGTTKDLNAISFDGEVGIAVGASGTMLTYSKGWSKATALTDMDYEGVMIIGDNGVSVGEDGFIIEKTGPGFDSPNLVTYDISSDVDTWPLSDLLFGQTYYYRLNANHGTDFSFWSGVKSFTTIASPELISPTSSSVTDLRVKFAWDEYEGTTNYIFEIADNDGFNQPRSFSPDDDTLWVNDLVFGQEYFWRVAAQHALDISSWSEVWSFTTVNSIALETPINEEIEVHLCPAFTWEAVFGASEYELWVDTDETFPDPETASVDEPTYQCQSQLNHTTVYYWKVRGKAGADVSEWSDVWSFTTEGGIGIEEQLDINEVNIFPNPGNGEFVLDIVSLVVGEYDVKVIDISGKLIFESRYNCQVGSNNIPINIGNVTSGVYSLTISNGLQTLTKRLSIK